MKDFASETLAPNFEPGVMEIEEVSDLDLCRIHVAEQLGLESHVGRLLHTWVAAQREFKKPKLEAIQSPSLPIELASMETGFCTMLRWQDASPHPLR